MSFLRWVLPACAAVSLVSVPAALAQGTSPGAARASRAATAPHVKAELIASPAVGPGGRLWLGVRFALEDGWHLYWQNPGDSGGPPTAQWQTPPHLRVGDFEWPVPERIEISGLVNYGYHGTVILPAPVTVAAGAQASGTIGVALRWMVCKDMCVPGRASLEIALPLAGGDRAQAAAWDAAIAKARALVPKSAPASWKARASSGRDVFEITLSTGRRETQGVFFPLEASLINDSAPQVITPLADGLRFTLKKSDYMSGEPSTLSGVVSLPGDRAFVVSAPVTR